MTDSLRKLFESNKLHGGKPDAIRVLVSLKSAPDDSCLGSLQRIGLTVKAVNGNKLTGEISSEFLAELEQHDTVLEVECSVTLKPTDASKRDA